MKASIAGTSSSSIIDYGGPWAGSAEKIRCPLSSLNQTSTVAGTSNSYRPILMELVPVWRMCILYPAMLLSSREAVKRLNIVCRDGLCSSQRPPKMQLYVQFGDGNAASSVQSARKWSKQSMMESRSTVFGRFKPVEIGTLLSGDSSS
ncbi:hypothetical protein sscle_12g087160 [Sclerotinia sclerotiorum 1980 UF-70]|uniref:Uncharacterized protein n=1 Tax=Sclerotinia sclerotiorum (strain ATCC 18683 / 1980 / Ss-1) TaxID=665079 RepID=A0A1D9QG77_SCLS1|nr:hypothetical protein sscle_12g087160 [Sclerotinia sclerotiorum 1980 UF-70]